MPRDAAPSADPSLRSAAAVLAVILDGRRADAFARAQETISAAAAFIDRTHRFVWDACSRLQASGTKIDAGSVSECLSGISFASAVDSVRPGMRKAQVLAEAAKAGCSYEDSALAAIGGMNAITDLAATFAPASSLEKNAADLMAHHLRRSLVALLEAQGKALASPEGVERARAIAADTINALATLAGDGAGSTGMGAAMRAALAAHDNAQQAAGRAACGWGVADLDEAVPLDPARLVVLAAPRSCGKTSLALQSVLATAKQFGSGAVAMASLEMPAPELAAIIAGRELGLSPKSIRGGVLSSHQRLALEELAARYDAERSISVKDAAFATTADQVCAWARQQQAITGGRLRLVVIDHLQALAASNPRHNEYQRISDATGKFKAVAIELGICVLCLSQLSREGTKQDRKAGGLSAIPPEPQLTDLRGSGTIEQDADAVVMLWPREGLSGAIVPVSAKVAKNRFGEMAMVPLEWNRAHGQTFSGRSTHRRGMSDADLQERERDAESNADWMSR